MQDVLNPAVGAFIFELVRGWLFGNALASAGSALLVLLALVLAWRRRLPAMLVPEHGTAIVIFCVAGLCLAMGVGERGDRQDQFRSTPAAAHGVQGHARAATVPERRG